MSLGLILILTLLAVALGLIVFFVIQHDNKIQKHFTKNYDELFDTALTKLGKSLDTRIVDLTRDQIYSLGIFFFNHISNEKNKDGYDHSIEMIESLRNKLTNHSTNYRGVYDIGKFINNTFLVSKKIDIEKYNPN